MRFDAAKFQSADVVASEDCPPTASVDGAEPIFTIGELAQEFGVTLRTLRFYEGRGFLSPRRAGAARLYRQSDRDRIAAILQGKKFGFTLREIQDLITTQEGDADHRSLRLSRRQCAEQINLLERQKRQIEHALTELRRAYSSHYLRKIERGEFSDG